MESMNLAKAPKKPKKGGKKGRKKKGRKAMKTRRVSNYAAAGGVAYLMFNKRDGVDVAGWLKQTMAPSAGVTRSEAAQKTAESVAEKLKKDGWKMGALIVGPPIARKVVSHFGLTEMLNPAFAKKGRKQWRLF